MPPSKKFVLVSVSATGRQKKIERGGFAEVSTCSLNGRSALKFNASGFHNPSQRSEQVHAIRRNQFGQNYLPMSASIIPKSEATIERHRQNLDPLFRAHRTVAHTSHAVVKVARIGA